MSALEQELAAAAQARQASEEQTSQAGKEAEEVERTLRQQLDAALSATDAKERVRTDCACLLLVLLADDVRARDRVQEVFALQSELKARSNVQESSELPASSLAACLWCLPLSPVSTCHAVSGVAELKAALETARNERDEQRARADKNELVRCVTCGCSCSVSCRLGGAG